MSDPIEEAAARFAERLATDSHPPGVKMHVLASDETLQQIADFRPPLKPVVVKVASPFRISNAR